MHDGTIQGQGGHEPFKVGNLAVFNSYIAVENVVSCQLPL